MNRIKCSLVVFLMSGALLSSAIAAPQRPTKGNEPSWPPANGTATTMISLAPGAMPESFQRLCDASLLIVEGYVQSIFPPWINGKSLETDAVLLVTRVLKGP